MRRHGLVLVAFTLAIIGGCRGVQEPLEPTTQRLVADEVAPDAAGAPTLLVTSDFLPPLLVKGVASPVIVDIPSGRTVRVCWSEQPRVWGESLSSAYVGPRVHCSEEQTLYFGTHAYAVESDDGLTRAEIRVNVISPDVEMSVDVSPRRYKGMLQEGASGVRCVLLGDAGLSVNDLSLESIRLGAAPPQSVVVRDAGRPGGAAGDCSRSSGRRDGENDLVMTFKIEDIWNLPDGWKLAPLQDGRTAVFLWARGPAGYYSGTDCIGFTGRR